MNQLEALNITAKQLGFTITQEITTGHIYRECNNCHAYAEFSGLHTLDFSPCRCGGIGATKTEQSGHNTPDAPEASLSAEPGENYKEMSRAGFYPLGSGRFTFQYRGIQIDLFLIGKKWLCRNYTADITVMLPVNTPILTMAAQLKQFILDTVPADRLREEGYHTLGWICPSVRAALAQERGEAIPFNGEVNPADADDSIPAQYGL